MFPPCLVSIFPPQLGSDSTFELFTPVTSHFSANMPQIKHFFWFFFPLSLSCVGRAGCCPVGWMTSWNRTSTRSAWRKFLMASTPAVAAHCARRSWPTSAYHCTWRTRPRPSWTRCCRVGTASQTGYVAQVLVSYPITAMLAVVMRSVFRGGRYSLKIKFDVLFLFFFFSQNCNSKCVQISALWICCKGGKKKLQLP